MQAHPPPSRARRWALQAAPTAEAVAEIVARFAALQASKSAALADEKTRRVEQARLAEAAMLASAVVPLAEAAAPVPVVDPSLKSTVLVAAHAYEAVTESESSDEEEAAAAAAAAAAAVVSKKKERKAWKEASAADLAMNFVNNNRATVANAAAKQRDDAK